MMKKKLLFCLFIFVLALSCSAGVFADGTLPRLMDTANLLTESEQSTLQATLDEISTNHSCDVVIVTVDSLEGKTSTEYADDYFDYNGYGSGDDHSGILLLLSMEDRDWSISTTGSAIESFTDAGQEYMMDDVLSYLGDDDYYGGFSEFATLCDEFLAQAATGEPYDNSNLPKEKTNPLAVAGGALLAALIVAFIVTSTMKAKLKSVNFHHAANDYINRDSLKVTGSRQLFLYNTLTRTPKPKDNDGGSSTHMGSSGTFHGGSSGKF